MKIRHSFAWLYCSGMPKSLNIQRELTKRGDTDVDPADWEGGGTSFKPAFEPIVFGRRPVQGTMVDNILAWGIGPLNLERASGPTLDPESGKWPSNVHLDRGQAAAIGAQAGKDPASFFWISKPNRAERVRLGTTTHPTQKPVDLMRRLVRLVTRADGVVLDPFAGSGATIEACILEGRKAVGIEREPVYVPLIEARMRRAFASAEQGDGILEADRVTLF